MENVKCDDKLVPTTLKVGPLPYARTFKKNLRFEFVPQAGQTIRFKGWEGNFFVYAVGGYELGDNNVKMCVELAVRTMAEEGFEILKKQGWTEIVK